MTEFNNQEKPWDSSSALIGDLEAAIPPKSENLDEATLTALREKSAKLYGEFSGYSDDQIGESLIVLNRLDEATNGALQGWRALSYVPSEAVSELNALYGGEVEALLKRGATTDLVESGNDLPAFLRASENMLEEQHGTVTTWREYTSERIPGTGGFRPKRIFSGPDYMLHLVESEQFIPACIDVAYEKALEESNHKRRDSALDFVQANIVQKMMDELLHHSLDLDFLASFRVRAMQRRDGKTLSYKEDGGYNLGYWRERTKRFVHNVEAIGAERAVELREEFGISNFDRYTVEQLQRMLKVIDKDPQMVERLRQGNVTVVVMDGLGDYNGASDGRVSQYDKNSTGDDTVLFYEVNEEGDLFGGMEKIQKLTNAQASVMVWAAHGGSEGINFNVDKEHFRLDKDDLSDPRYGDFIRAHMRPHSVTGEKIFILSSCSQAKAPEATSHHPDLPETQSNLEILARNTTLEDNITFIGMEQPGAISAAEDGTLWLYNTKTKKYTSFTRIARNATGVETTKVQTVTINPLKGTA